MAAAVHCAEGLSVIVEMETVGYAIKSVFYDFHFFQRNEKT